MAPPAAPAAPGAAADGDDAAAPLPAVLVGSALVLMGSASAGVLQRLKTELQLLASSLRELNELTASNPSGLLLGSPTSAPVLGERALR